MVMLEFSMGAEAEVQKREGLTFLHCPTSVQLLCVTLWYRTTENWDTSTELLAPPFAHLLALLITFTHLLALHCSLY